MIRLLLLMVLIVRMKRSKYDTNFRVRTTSHNHVHNRIPKSIEDCGVTTKPWFRSGGSCEASFIANLGSALYAGTSSAFPTTQDEVASHLKLV